MPLISPAAMPSPVIMPLIVLMPVFPETLSMRMMVLLSSIMSMTNHHFDSAQ